MKGFSKKKELQLAVLAYALWGAAALDFVKRAFLRFLEFSHSLSCLAHDESEPREAIRMHEGMNMSDPKLAHMPQTLSPKQQTLNTEP